MKLQVQEEKMIVGIRESGWSMPWLDASRGPGVAQFCNDAFSCSIHDSRPPLPWMTLG